MVTQHYEEAHLDEIDHAIDRTEMQIDAQLDLIERLECSGESTESAIDAFAELVDNLAKLAQQRLEILNAFDQ